MSARRITRRSLLASGAGVMASWLLRPSGALALLAGPPAPTLSRRWIGQLTPQGTTIELASSADLVGVEWRAPRWAGRWALSPGGPGWGACVSDPLRAPAGVSLSPPAG
jgi:hypothetical protein